MYPLMLLPEITRKGELQVSDTYSDFSKSKGRHFVLMIQPLKYFIFG